MKRFFIPFLTIIFALACTPDNGGDNNGNQTSNEGYKPSGKITVKGMVYGGGNDVLEGVVISDGLLCVKTDENGYYELDSDLSRTKFIMASIPSGYSAPSDSNSLPVFFHRVTDEERKSNMCIHTFDFYPITNNPDRFTLFVGADPQPRASTAGYDNIAYHSLDICEDFYRDMRETAATITDRNIYGLMLGDIVHENMSLFDNYIAGLKSLGNVQMFNILGNHDNDPKSKTDVEGRHSFEEKLGPTYYSFNIGKIHFVVLDNLIMKLRSDGTLRDFDQGLTDEIWQWLQNDLSYVDRSTTIMVAAHSPMFMQTTMNDRSQGASGHRYDYANLLSKYAKVHAWAGHSHTTFNYNYPETSNLKSIEVHTVARSTGELWTNEYISNGTPRGYTIVEVDGEDVKWYFKPTKYQTAKFTGKTSPQPDYKYRDWSYDESGVAKLKSGKVLDESYQMKVYKPGEYHKTYKDMINGKAADSKYVYVDVFLWDDKWEAPKYNGATMTKVGYKDAYCLWNYDIKNHYSTYGYKLQDSSDYGPSDEDYHTLFRAFESKSSGTGTVTVKDRFGNEYASTITW
ncbi:MAG: calcineurin-like phosphoesterase C-terminal domain-containing protein [Alistipes sp.]|nr:calcineurin-like phosphoesterase C-terminal domain-containing protein [Alistipes sp.]